ncbi:MAG: AAA family ATPase, partial [Rubrivivax sp.]|nr:AAA family ATPase [Rubrivivax sp.]
GPGAPGGPGGPGGPVGPGVPGAAPSSPQRPSGPAAPLSSEGFVGRADELRRIGELLARDDARLVTVLGPGGVGKTRLARRAIDMHGGAFADGAAFVALEDAASAAEATAVLARELGLPGKGEPEALVAEALHARRMLLVLDNFEQLVGEHAWLARLLDACPGLHLLVTSRLRLALPGEWLLPVDGLPVPEPEDEDRAEAFDAVQLFVRTAQRVEPALAAGIEGADIVEICRLVGGLPLALELAAAWTRVMSCRAIADELRAGTELLRSDDAARPARHASIERVFEQSWRLLAPVERDVLLRLAVFRGGFTAAAARAVAGGSLPVLGALIDKSLLRKEGARLQLHPLVHQMAAQRLAGTPLLQQQADTAHARHFHDLLQQRLAALKAGEADALLAVDADFDNVRRAWRVTLSLRPPQAPQEAPLRALGRGARPLLHYLEHRGRFGEGLALLDEALAAPAVQADAGLQATLQAHAAHLAFRLDRYAEARAGAAAALRVADRAHEGRAAGEVGGEVGDVDTCLLALMVLGRCHLTLGELDEARRFFARALRLASAGSDPGVRFTAMGSLALVERAAGDVERALALAGELLEEQRRRGDMPGQAQSHNAMAAMHLDRQEYERAAVQLEAALALCDRHGFVNTRGMVLTNLTGVALYLGRLEQAAGHAARALEHSRATGNRGQAAFLQRLVAGIETRRGNLPAARVALRESFTAALSLGRDSLLANSLEAFAELLQAEGHTLAARRVVRFIMRLEVVNAPSIGQLEGLLAAWPLPPAQAGADDAAWPGLTLAGVAQRIADETDAAHRPLRAAIEAVG